MLLFIDNNSHASKDNMHFNTSHVTVYPSHSLFYHHLFSISIHLMLLFIEGTCSGEKNSY